MSAKKQLQFRADIKANRKPWDSKVEFAMPGELKLYRDYELAGVSEHSSAAGKKGGKKGGKIGVRWTRSPSETNRTNNYKHNIWARCAAWPVVKAPPKKSICRLANSKL
jgi:hypothetical protein